jgi:hypothetical protein
MCYSCSGMLTGYGERCGCIFENLPTGGWARGVLQAGRSRAQFPMVSLGFFIIIIVFIIVTAATWFWGISWGVKAVGAWE